MNHLNFEIKTPNRKPHSLWTVGLCWHASVVDNMTPCHEERNPESFRASGLCSQPSRSLWKFRFGPGYFCSTPLRSCFWVFFFNWCYFSWYKVNDLRLKPHAEIGDDICISECQKSRWFVANRKSKFQKLAKELTSTEWSHGLTTIADMYKIYTMFYYSNQREACLHHSRAAGSCQITANVLECYYLW